MKALDYKGAAESFERALEDNPRSMAAHWELGVLFDQHENDYAAALYHYNKALKLRPNSDRADIIRQRIPGCKQELVKADSLSVINPSALRETERLREENQMLRKQLGLLQAELASRPPSAASSAGILPPSGSSQPRTTSTLPSTSVSGITGTPTAAARTPGSDTGARLTPLPTRGRTHTVRSGETAASISRQYRVGLNSLLSANPGLDPKRMRIGQVLNIPSS